MPRLQLIIARPKSCSWPAQVGSQSKIVDRSSTRLTRPSMAGNEKTIKWADCLQDLHVLCYREEVKTNPATRDRTRDLVMGCSTDYSHPLFHLSYCRIPTGYIARDMQLRKDVPGNGCSVYIKQVKLDTRYMSSHAVTFASLPVSCVEKCLFFSHHLEKALDWLK